MEALKQTLAQVVGDVWSTFAENWPYLLVGVVFAAALRTYVGSSRIERVLRGKTWMTVIGAVLLATFTPFCSCGTEAVVLSLMAGSVPWAPIVTFMVASPLTSPEQLVLSGGLFGWPFALTYFVGATVLGLAAGFLTAWVEKRGWLAGQARMIIADDASCCSGAPSWSSRASSWARGLLPRRAATVGAPAAGGASGPSDAPVAATCCTPSVELSPASAMASAPAAGRSAVLDGSSHVSNLDVGAGDRAARSEQAVLTASSTCCSATPAAPVTVPAPAAVAVAAAAAGAACCAPAVDLHGPMGGASNGPGHDDLELPGGGQGLVQRWKLAEFARNLWQVARRIGLFFFAFSAIGYLLIAVIPNSLFTGFLGGDSPYAVVVMALLGIPVYITTDGSLPLVASLINSGMSKGAAMAFLITGAGTSLGAIAGALIIARWRVVGLVVGILFVGALLLGFGTQLTFDL